MRNQHTRRLEYDRREVKELFLDLRSQPTYPVVQGDPLLILYDLMAVLGMPEEEIYGYLGPRGYLRVAKSRAVDATRVAQILFGEVGEDEEGTGE